MSEQDTLLHDTPLTGIPSHEAAPNAADFASTEPAEDQDELDAVRIEECGESLVDFLVGADESKLRLSPAHPVFEFPRVHLLRESVAKMVQQAAQALPTGLTLQVVEGYRPLVVQREHFRHSLAEAKKRFPDADEKKIFMEAGRYSAPPDAVTPPPHVTGGAVDVEIVDADGNRLDFTSPFDMLDMRHAAMNAPGLSPEALINRELLRSIMEPTGLTNYVDEWWHWSYGDNGWALRVDAPCAIYNRIEAPTDAHWVGDLTKLPTTAVDGEF